MISRWAEEDGGGGGPDDGARRGRLTSRLGQRVYIDHCTHDHRELRSRGPRFCGFTCVSRSFLYLSPCGSMSLSVSLFLFLPLYLIVTDS